MVFRALVVASGDASKELDTIEEAFDKIALPVELACGGEALIAVGP